MHLQVSMIIFSSSGGAEQTALCILRACYGSWLHQDWSETGSTAILVQPTDIKRTQYTVCVAPPEDEQVIPEIWRGSQYLIINKLNKKCITLVSLR
jgi:hypothetical protein